MFGLRNRSVKRSPLSARTGRRTDSTFSSPAQKRIDDCLLRSKRCTKTQEREYEEEYEAGKQMCLPCKKSEVRTRCITFLSTPFSIQSRRQPLTCCGRIEPHSCHKFVLVTSPSVFTYSMQTTIFCLLSLVVEAVSSDN